MMGHRNSTRSFGLVGLIAASGLAVPVAFAQTYTEDTTLTEDFDFESISVRSGATLTIAEGVNFGPTPGSGDWNIIGSVIFKDPPLPFPVMINHGNLLADGDLLEPGALGALRSGLDFRNFGSVRAINGAHLASLVLLDSLPFVNHGVVAAESGGIIDFAMNTTTPNIVNEAGGSIIADNGRVRFRPGFQNHGSISAINDGVIELGGFSGHFTASDLAGINATGGRIELGNTLDLGGATYDFATTGPLHLELGAVVRDGMIKTGTGTMMLTSGQFSEPRVLDGTSVQGNIVIDAAKLDLKNNSTIQGEVSILGNGSLTMTGNQQTPITGTTIRLLGGNSFAHFGESVLAETSTIIAERTPGDSPLRRVWFARNEGLIDVGDHVSMQMVGSDNGNGIIRLGDGSSLELQTHRGGLGSIERLGDNTVTMTANWSLEGQTVTIDASHGTIESSAGAMNGTLNITPDADFSFVGSNNFSGLNLKGTIPMSGGSMVFTDVSVNGTLVTRGPGNTILNINEPTGSVPTVDYNIHLDGGGILIVPMIPGYDTDGPLHITKNSTITNTNGERFFFQGGADNPIELHGTIDLRGAGTPSKFFILDPGAINTGTIIARDGHQIDFGIAQFLVHKDGARLGLDGGTFFAANPHNALPMEPGSTLFGSGVLSFLGAGANVGGVLEPMDGDRGGIGLLDFRLGGLTLQDTAELRIDIGGTAPNEFDRIIATTARLDGLLSLSLINGFIPDPADVFEFIAADQRIGTFAGLPDGERIDLASGFGSFEIEYFDHGVRLVNFVPGIGTVLPMGLGMAWLGRRRRVCRK